MSRTRFASLAASLLLLAIPPARAGGPEQLEQLEPSAGETQAEYSASYGGEDRHTLEMLTGVSARLAIGVEAEFEGSEFESAGIAALYRFADMDERHWGLGFAFDIALGRDRRLAEAEARAIAERRTSRWWLQANAIVRHSRERVERGTGTAYALSAQHRLGDGGWIGIEASGQLSRISGDAEAGQHYLGPSLTFEHETGERELEVGVAWMQRVAGEGARSGPRVFVQLGL